jgi:hypothetical protein
MNEELQEILAEILDKSVKVAQETGQWAMDKAPALIEQFLTWHFYEAVFFASLSLITTVICVSTIIVCKKQAAGNKYSETQMGSTVVSIIVGVVAFIALLVNIYNIIFITVAPEIYLIQTLLN